MEMTRLRLLAIAALVALAAGCGKKKKEEPPAPPPVEGLDAIPAGVTRVVGGDVAKLASSRLVRRGVAAIFERDPEIAGRIRRLVKECELEPGKNVAGFIIGLGDKPGEAVMAVRGEFVGASLAACVQRAIGDGGQLVTKQIGGRPAYKARGGGSPVWFALGSPKSLVVAASEAWLAKGLGQGPRLTADPAMKALLAAAPTKATLWGAGKVPEKVASDLASAAGGQIQAPESMTASLELGDSLEAELRTRFAKAEDANKLKSLAKLQMPAIVAVAQRHHLGQLLSRLRVDAQGSEVVLRLTASEQQLSDLLAAVDSGPTSLQNPASSSSPDPEEGDKGDGQGKPPAGDEAPLRQ